jgi:hypothetical protein
VARGGGQRIKEMSIMPGTDHDTAMNLATATLKPATAGLAPGCRLYGRRGEREMLDQLVADARAGQSLRTSTYTAATPLLAASIFLDVLNVFLFFLQIFSNQER